MHNRLVNARDLANSICATLQRNGFQALLAGGCVRDLLLGREPSDYDVATDATPERVMELFPESVAVGAQFGVILIPAENFKVEVATFRSDVSYTDGRRPDAVIYAKTPEQDVHRRDFTINGLLMRHDSGEILDFVGGREDLKAGVVRAIGNADKRIEEDKLRMLRAVRFAARFGFEIEAETFRSICKQVENIHQVSAERVRDELTKMLTEGAAGNAFRLLDQTWLLAKVLPEIAAMKGVEQPPQYHPEGDVWVHTCMMLDGIAAGSSPTLAWGVLLHDVGKPPTFRSVAETGDRIRFDGHVEVGVRMGAEICRRLKMSNDDTDQILALIANHMKFKDAEQMRASTLKKFVRMPKFDEHMALHRLDCLSSHRMLDSYNFVSDFLARTPPEQVRPPRLLTGNDLLYMGLEPGPKFREVLQAVEDAQLEGAIQTREEALRLAEEAYRGVKRP
ncbi:MAG: HD domain-containing protein [Candidatus Acidiferrum sp.]